jgi:ribosomal protein L39E
MEETSEKSKSTEKKKYMDAKSKTQLARALKNNAGEPNFINRIMV